jgi:flagellar biosynthesis chaperone FliJ
LQGLNVSEDSAALVRSLTEDVVNLEAVAGRALWEMGRKLGSIRTILKDKGVTGAWEKWCEHFAYSKDYANRMIQVADVFKDAEAVPMNLTFRHFREVARFNFHNSTPEDVAKLARVVSAAQLNTKDTRELISAANAGKVDLDLKSLAETSPKLRKQLDDQLKKAREMGAAEAAERADELQSRITQMDEQTKQLQTDVNERAARVTELSGQVKLHEAATKIGEGDPEIGKLKIQLEQATQAKETVEMQLREVAADASKARQNLERFMHSPVGQAKADVKKSFEELQKFFKDSMTPAFLALRINRVDNEETKKAILSVVDVIDGWSKQVRQEIAQQMPTTTGTTGAGGGA